LSDSGSSFGVFFSALLGAPDAGREAREKWPGTGRRPYSAGSEVAASCEAVAPNWELPSECMRPDERYGLFADEHAEEAKKSDRGRCRRPYLNEPIYDADCYTQDNRC